MNAIDDDLPVALSAAVAEADADPEVHVMVLAGNGQHLTLLGYRVYVCK